MTAANEMWFEKVVATETAHVRAVYNSNFTLLEACGGIGTEPDGRAPGACGRIGVMNGVQDVSYVRLVFAPVQKGSVISM